jgi:phosphoribosylformylglycinamidine synthase
MKAIVNIQLKEGILDPQGKAVHHALESLGFKEIKSVRVGKQIILDMDMQDKKEMIDKVDKMCKILLSNPVIEDYIIETEE